MSLAVRLAGAARWRLLLMLAVAACGRIDRADVVALPRQDDYATEIQPIFERLGCSASEYCHARPQGNLKIVPMPDAAALQENYLGVKAMLDLQRPAESPLLANLLQTSANPDALHNPACFRTKQSCAWRKIEAWAAWQSDRDPRPQDLDCTVAASDPAIACGNPQALDVCCPREAAPMAVDAASPADAGDDLGLR